MPDSAASPVPDCARATSTTSRSAARHRTTGRIKRLTHGGRIGAAIDLLTAIALAGSRPADAVANDYFRARRYIGSSDRRAISEEVWRVLRSLRRLSWWLHRAGGPPDPRLLVAASALLQGGSIDGLAQIFSGAHFCPAALDRTELAILRKLVGQGLDDPAMPLAVRGEVPDWLLPLLQQRFGDTLADELAALQRPAPLDLRVNLLKATRDTALAALAAEGLQAMPTPLSPWGLRIEGRRSVTTGPAFQSGMVEIQDEGSQLVAALVDAQPGMRVVDWCAGAGGKTLALAMMMQNRGHLIACDVAEARLDGAVRRLRRAGVHNVERHLVVAGDKWAKRRAGSFDRVLVDAPCTGTGTWRRNPDARHRLRENDLNELVAKQAAILDQAATLVRKGGRLVYATCSLLTAENEAQVDTFLIRHANFALARPGDAVTKPMLVLTPGHDGTDGFFAAVLERVA